MPFVSIIIAAYNEEKVIEEKLKSILDSSYDPQKLEILVGSDGSNDRTDEIVKAVADKHPQVHLYRFERSGKSGILNQLTPKAKAELIVYTDANVIFSENTLEKLMGRFASEEIGLVGSNITSKEHLNKGISFQEEKYIERENMIKYREGLLWGCMMGAFGGCYAMRKSLFTKIPGHFIVDDFYLTLKVLQAQKKTILEPDSICFEEVSIKESEEFRRKVRMSSGNFQNLKYFLSMLWRSKSTIAFSFFSHKILRWITPILLFFAFITSAFLFQYHSIYRLAFYSQCFLLLLPVVNYFLRLSKVKLKLVQFVSYFYSMNLALFIGMIKYLSGSASAIWEPTERKPGQ